MKISCVKKALIKQIDSVASQASLFCRNPGKDFSRSRKLSFAGTMKIVLGFGARSLSNELLDAFRFAPDAASPSAFVQCRNKILPGAFETVFKRFSMSSSRFCSPKLYKGYRLLAVDGSDIHIPTDPSDKDSFFPGANGQAPYSLLHLNALYDLLNRLYVDVSIQKRRNINESRALIDMMESSWLPPSIVIADRGYESYNVMAHFQEANWFYLIRIKDRASNGICSGLKLPDSPEFDMDLVMNMTRSMSNQVKALLKDRNSFRFVPQTCVFDYLPLLNNCRTSKPVFYSLPFRILRFSVSDTLAETVVTNLPRQLFPPDEIRSLYSLRWGIETSFRKLKHTVGLLHFHSKKTDSIFQEIYAALTMYNFTELVASSVVLRSGKSKHTYQVNFSVAVHVCKELLTKNLRPPDAETAIQKYVVPIRQNRKYKRIMSSSKRAVSFTYRVA